MIENNQKTSLLVPHQLPEHVRDNPEYGNFTLFVQAYYEWMEQTGNVTDRSKNVLNYKDVDKTTTEFLEYFTNDFLPYFPKETLINKQEAVKIARQLYQTKGTPASYEFLFRTLYNSSFDVFYTKDAVLKASAGTWYISKSLKLSSTDANFLKTKNLRIFGNQSKSIATIENAIFVGNKIEVFISNIERLFTSGETARIVDSNNQDVLFDGQVLEAKIVGQVSQLKINTSVQDRGLLYQPGDPVIIYGGLTSNTGIGATAIIGDTTKGSLQRINVKKGGYGYSRYNAQAPVQNTIISILNGGGAKANVGSVSPYLPPQLVVVNGGRGYKVNDQITYQNAAFAYVTTVDANGTITTVNYSTTVNALAIINVTANVVSTNTQANNAIIKTSAQLGNAIANVVLLPIDVIGFKKDITIGNTDYHFANATTYSSNANTTLSKLFTFTSLETYPISSIIVDNQGGGLSKTPEVTAISTFVTEDSFDTFAINSDLASLGILGPIQVISPGTGYRANDKITISGGQGLGAYANVTTVDASGGILRADYVFNTTENPPKYPKGGMGYTNEYLPGTTVVSTNTAASGAVLSIPGILGTGAEFDLVVDRVGSITTLNLIDYGEDYVETPKVSLKVQDIVVSNVAIENLPKKGDVIFQGPTIDLASYTALINSISLLSSNEDYSKSLYNLRVFNYNSNPNTNLPLTVNLKNINYIMANSSFPQFDTSYEYTDTVGNITTFTRSYNNSGFINYGDGNAKANAQFLNGLVIGTGEYLNSQGQPSSFDVLQNEVYNNFTYQITVEKEIEKYREVLLNLLHPTGMNIVGRYAMKSNNSYNLHMQEGLSTGYPLRDLLGSNLVDAISFDTSFSNKSTNIIRFNNLLGANLANILTSNSSIQISTDKKIQISSPIVSFDSVANTITLKANTWLTFGNVARVTANAGSNTINIKSFTWSYNLVNNGVYSNTAYPLKDLVYAGDKVLVDNNTSRIVSSIDYINGIIYLSSNITSNANSLMSVNRTLQANSTILSDQIRIMSPLGLQYIPELTTESGFSLTTEDDRIILLG